MCIAAWAVDPLMSAGSRNGGSASAPLFPDPLKREWVASMRGLNTVIVVWSSPMSRVVPFSMAQKCSASMGQGMRMTRTPLHKPSPWRSSWYVLIRKESLFRSAWL